MALPRLIVPAPLRAAIVAHAVRELPNECCGLLGGHGGASPGILIAVRDYPLVNVAASPVAYESDARGMFNAMRDMRRDGLDVVAVYHSHPTSPPVPSRTDLERNYSEQVVNLIVSLQNAQPEVRAWWLRAEDYREADWDCVG